MDDPERLTCVQMTAMAKEKLRAAEELFKAGLYDDSLSRAYYAAFHIVSMLLFLTDKSFSRHGQVLGAFNHDFIATGIFPKELGKSLGTLFDERQSADYDIFQRANQDEAKKGLLASRKIIDAILDYAITHHDLIIPG